MRRKTITFFGWFDIKKILCFLGLHKYQEEWSPVDYFDGKKVYIVEKKSCDWCGHLKERY